MQLIEHNDIHFIVLGDGALKLEYMNRYSNCKNISFMPKIPRLMVQSVLKHADVLYLSTFNSKVWNYGQSLNKIIDYMLAARPIIASYSGYPSMINESGSGYFVPAEDVFAVIDKIMLLKICHPKKDLKWVVKDESGFYKIEITASWLDSMPILYSQLIQLINRNSCYLIKH